MDSRVYRVEFDDGEVCELTTNVISESMYTSCDVDGNEYILFDSFVDYKSILKAATKENQRIVHNGRNSLCRSTVGWHLCVQWKDGSTSWQSLKDLEEAYPVAVAEYAVTQGIDDEPAINWWVHHVLRKREHIIALVKKRITRFLKKTHKFGIRNAAICCRSLHSRQEERQHPLGGFDCLGNEERENCVQNPSQ